MTKRDKRMRPEPRDGAAAAGRNDDTRLDYWYLYTRKVLNKFIFFTSLMLCGMPIAFAQPVTVPNPYFTSDDNVRINLGGVYDDRFRAYMTLTTAGGGRMEFEEGRKPVHLFGTTVDCRDGFTWPQGQHLLELKVYTLANRFECPVDSCEPCPAFAEEAGEPRAETKKWCLTLPGRVVTDFTDGQCPGGGDDGGDGGDDGGGDGGGGGGSSYRPWLTIDDATVDEDAGEAHFSVSINRNSRNDISVDYTTADGTALAGTDYVATTGTLTIPSPDFGGTIVVPILDDYLDEPDENFTVTLSNPVDGRISDGEATGTISDDDEPPPPGSPSLSIDDVLVGEDAGNAEFTVTLTHSFDQTISADYVTADGTATAMEDYTPATGTLTIEAGSVSGSISVPILDDTVEEPDETFTIRLKRVRNASVSDGEGTGTINDDDGAPTPPPDMSIDDVTVAEDGGNATFSVSLSASSDQAISVDYATADGTATADSDYDSATGTLTIDPGSTTGTIAVPVLDDELDEPDETFAVTLTNAINGTISDADGEATITDNDEPPPASPSISVDDVSVAEDADNAQFTVTLSDAFDQAVTVQFATIDGTAKAGSDYTVTSGTLTIDPGSTTGTIAVPVLDDELDEPDETFAVTLTNAINGTISDADGEATITDNDEPPPASPSISVDDVSVAEDAGNAQFTVTLSDAFDQAVTVQFATIDGTAKAGSDYTVTSGTLTIDPGSTTGTIAVPVLDDELDEPDETFAVTLSNAINGTISDADGEATITDNDQPPPASPSISVDDVSVAEDAGNAQFTVTLSDAFDQAVTVQFATIDGTAKAGSDYTVTSGTLTIDPGSTTGTIAVPVLDDELDEPDETFAVTLTNAINGTISDADGEATITDNDEPPPASPSISVDDVSVAEDAGNAQFTVTLSDAFDQAVTVQFATIDGTAKAGSDYTVTSGTLTIDPGSTTGTIAVPVLDDELDEPDETFAVTLTNAINGTISDADGEATITDNDEPPPASPSISVDDVSVAEDAGNAQFTVTLSDAFDQAVTVQFATIDGTAKAGSDYTVTSGTLTIDPGSTTGTIAVPVLDDELDEPDETFAVTLSNAINGTISDADGEATITDNDQPPPASPSISVDDVSIAEAAGNAQFTVTLSNAFNQAVTVQFSTADGTAEAGSDYTATNGTLTIDPGSTTGTIAVPVLDDELDEPDETFAVTLTNAINGTISDADGEATITDNDEPPGSGVVGVAKEAIDTRVTGNGQVRSTIRIHIANVGDGTANRVQVSDDLRLAFPSPAAVSIVAAPRLTGTSLTLNGAYDGVESTDLLTGTDSLEAGASAMVEFTVEVALNGAAGPFENQATAVSEDDAGEENSDLSDNGSNPDPNGDGDPGSAGEDDPTPIEFPAALTGNVFADLDVNGMQDADEADLADWRVEVAPGGGDGEPVAEATTDGNGAYFFADVDPDNVIVRFRHPDSNAVWHEESAAIALHSVTRVDHGVVPGGRIYDSVSREVIAGAVLALADNSGMRLPAECLLHGQQAQRTGRDGAYRFDLAHGAHSDCPTASATYKIEVIEAPDGYNAPPSLLIPPAGTALTVASCPEDPNPEEPCVVFPEPRPPADARTADYYLAWVVADGDGTVVHNHVPLDPTTAVLPDRLITVSKRATVRTVNVGDLVGYHIQVTNPTEVSLSNLQLLDNIPAGFAFVEESASLQKPGLDGTLGTGDDLSVRLDATVSDPVSFASFDLPAGAAITVRYMTRVTTGASPGEHINSVKPYVSGKLVGNEATASVEVISDPIFEKTTVIGKVFDDQNGDGWQDPGEQGVPGVRLATISGLIVETDVHGRYHLADISVNDAAIGSNFIIKLDTATLPNEAVLTTENPRVIRLTQALMSKVNFGVKLPARERQVAQPPRGNKMIREIRSHHIERIEPVRFESGKSNILASYLERLRTLVARYLDKPNLRVRFSGHTDNEPLGRNAQAIYGDNQGLSEARAREVAEFVAAELKLSQDLIETVGHAERLPVASNRTREGMALNRRVETELIYDGYAAEERRLEALPASIGPTTEVRYAEEQTRLEPARFAPGSTSLTSDQTAMIDRSLEPFEQLEVVSVKVAGHADALPVLSPEVDEEDNERLSRARAESVAAYLAGRLNLDAEEIQVEARGSADPIGDNRTISGRALNRRADIELVYKRVAETVTTRVLAVAPVQMAPTEQIGGGRIWLTEDILAQSPQLNVLALSDVAVDESGTMKRPVKFAAYSNYAAWIEEYRLQIYRAQDTDLVRPLATLTTKRLDHDQAFEFLDASLQLKRGERLAYVLRATGANGREDVTHVRQLGIVNARRSQQPREANSIWGQSNLAKQSIKVRGSRVRVQGEEFRPGAMLRVDGQEVPVDGNGRFVTEMHLSPGTKSIVVSGVNEGRTWSEVITADVDENYTFIVGLANVTIGQTSVSDRFESLGTNDSFDESVHVDGRLAFYLKAKIRGKYLITAQLDTTEDELDNLTDNLKRKDPRRVFRQLDPDKYYPVYGDDSTTTSDVYSQGPFFLRVDWDRNQVLLGNYNTGLTDTEHMQYNRSLYGAKLAYKSDDETRFGDPKRSLTAFASEAQSAAAHVTFRATGGSLYYLKHTDIVLGSEKVWVEIRQRDTAQVLERQDYITGRDYEVDALQGRIILNRPLSQVSRTRGPSIIRTRPLEGDDVYLLVDYEYVPDAFEADHMTYGARGKTWIGDHVSVGASKIVDQQEGRDFDLEGIDITFKAGQGTYLNLEIARSESLLSSASFDSVDGGLSFLSRSGELSSPATSGDAFAVEGRVNLAEYSDLLTGDVRAWWKERDAGFSAGRLGHRFDTVEKGIDAMVQAGENIGLQASYAERHEGSLSASRVGRVQADVRTGRLTVGGELRHEDIRRTALYGYEVPDGDALLAGVRVGYDLDDTRTIYGSVQTGLDESGSYVHNDMIALGIDTQVNDRTAISLEASEGDRGSALSGGFEYTPADRFGVKLKSGIGSGALTQFSGNYELDDGHELYGSYALDPDRTFGDRNILTLGQRRDMGNRLGIFTESQFGDDERYAGASHSFGLDYKTMHGWILTGLVTVSDNKIAAPASIERHAFSFGAAIQRPAHRFSSKIEYRKDDGPATKVDQYIGGTTYTYIANENRRWLGRLNISWTDDKMLGLYDARFVEFNIGHAYRPVANDRWNTLVKYGYFHDLVSAGQDAVRPDQRAHILSAEALYSLNRTWEIGGKVAVKEGRMRSFRNTGAWYDSSVMLGVARVRRHVINEWDALAEYRLLYDRKGDNRRHGVLIGVYRQFGEQFEMGAGYNFTDFSDDIRDAGYDHQGWFIDLIGKL